MSANGRPAAPYAMLRAGFPYLTTYGMRRVTTYPMDIAFDAADRMYVLCRHDFADLVNIRIINYDDEDLGTVEGTGRGQAGLVWPVNLAMGPDGLLYVSDEGTHKISRLNPEGGLVSQWGEQGSEPGKLDRPSGFAFDGEGTIFVADTLNHRIQQFTLEGDPIATFGSYGSGPGQFNMPWGLCFDSDGNLAVADWRNDRVQLLTPGGEFVSEFGRSGSGNGEFNRPAGIAVDAHGDIYVADRQNNRIQLFNPRGDYVQQFHGAATVSKIGRRYILSNPKTLRLREMSDLEQTQHFREPPSVRVDSNFRMYVADFGAHRIQVYKKEAYPLTEAEIFPDLRSPTLQTT